MGVSLLLWHNQGRGRPIGGGGDGAWVGAYDDIPNLVHVYEPARRTLVSYTGDLVRLRRSGDNAESDFGYVDATGELDTAAIATWLGGGSGYVVTVYDQKGTDNITQPTTIRQPLYSANAQNGHAGMIFDGSAVFMQSDYLRGIFVNDGTISQPFSIYGIGQLDASVVNDDKTHILIAGTDEIATTPQLSQSNLTTPDSWRIYAGATISSVPSDSVMNLWATIFNGANSYLFINNAPLGAGNAGAGGLEGGFLGDSEAAWSGNSWKGPILSCVIASLAHNNTQRTAMQTAMNEYWAVFPFDYPPLPEGEPDFTMIFIPDTQSYVDPELKPEFIAITDWIANSIESLNIQAVFHGGDIVIPSTEDTWENAMTALATIEAISDLPILYAIGNHDYDGPSSPHTSIDRLSTLWNANIGQGHYTTKSWWNGGFYEENKSENAYLLVTLGEQDYIILSLEFGPGQGVIDWADALLTTHDARDAIIITHSYLWRSGQRCTTGDQYNPHDIFEGEVEGEVHDGEEMWNELIKLHENIVQVFCGHERGFRGTIDDGDEGNLAAQNLIGHAVTKPTDYGQLGIVRYYLSQNQVAYTRYSPYLDYLAFQYVLDYKAI